MSRLFKRTKALQQDNPENKRDDEDRRFETAKLHYQHLASKLKRAGEFAFEQKRKRRADEEEDDHD